MGDRKFTNPDFRTSSLTLISIGSPILSGQGLIPLNLPLRPQRQGTGFYTAMTGMKSAATLPLKTIRPLPPAVLASTQAASPDRQRLLQQAATLESSARQAAEQGDLAASARFILEALDLERRAGGLGPQVLQLIKPRS